MKSLFKPVLAASLVFFATSANALLMLEISDGTTTYTAYDNESGNDFDWFFGSGVTDGLLISGGSLGGYTSNVLTGSSSPYLGGLNIFEMDFNSVNTGSGDITVKLTQTDISQNGHVRIEFGGTSDGTVSFQSYMDSSNTAFGMETLLDDSGSLSNAFSGTGSGAIDLLDPYSMTMIATISHTDAGNVTSFDYNIKVPEPSSLALLGLGLIGAGFASRRKVRKIA